MHGCHHIPSYRIYKPKVGKIAFVQVQVSPSCKRACLCDVRLIPTASMQYLEYQRKGKVPTHGI